MSAVGGSIESVSLNGRTFAVAADADASMFLGGKTNEKQPNGDGTTRTVQSRMPWSLDGIAVAIDHARGDLEFLQELSDSGADVPVSVTYTDGTIYGGRGGITGEVNGSSQSATCPITLGGPGKLAKQ